MTFSIQHTGVSQHVVCNSRSLIKTLHLYYVYPTRTYLQFMLRRTWKDLRPTNPDVLTKHSAENASKFCEANLTF